MYLQCVYSTEGHGELVQLVIGEGQGDKMVEVGESIDPTDHPYLTPQ